MRITDVMLQNSFMNNLNRAKSRVSKLQIELATQSKINTLSDSPLGTARVMRLNSHIGGLNTYLKNIGNSRSFLDYTITSMDAMQNEIQKVMGTMTDINNSIQDENLDSFADKIDLIVDSMVGLANSKYDDRYIFGGTSSNTKPFEVDGNGQTLNVLGTHIDGIHKINISENIQQQINMPGKELFQSILDLKGNLDSSSVIGDSQDLSSLVYDSDGNEYTLSTSFVKTEDNSYDLNYSISDSDSNEIFSSSAAVVYDSVTGAITSLNGENYKDIQVQVPGTKINFVLDFNNIEETGSGTSLSGRLNQKSSIIDTLIAVRDKLRNGERPNDYQGEVIEEFEQFLLNKLSKVGNISGILSDTEDMINNQLLQLEKLRSQEIDIDVAKSLLELETQQFTLDLTYKTSATILPKSLLDYL